MTADDTADNKGTATVAGEPRSLRMYTPVWTGEPNERPTMIEIEISLDDHAATDPDRWTGCCGEDCTACVCGDCCMCFCCNDDL
jgi:hypothetical protein